MTTQNPTHPAEANASAVCYEAHVNASRAIDERSTIQKAESDINYAGDGPVGQFQAIYRAVEMASRNQYDVTTIAEALDNVLNDIKEYGTIPSNEGC